MIKMKIETVLFVNISISNSSYSIDNEMPNKHTISKHKK